MPTVLISRPKIANVLARIPETHVGGESRHIRGLARIDGFSFGACRTACRQHILGIADSVRAYCKRGRSPKTFRGDNTVFYALQPRFLPENQTTRLAPIVTRSVAARILKMHRVLHSANAPLLGVFAGFVGALIYAKPSPTVLKHLRHEREIFQAAIFVQGREDFLATANFHPFAGAEIQDSRSIQARIGQSKFS
jgi:hypothetical protein